MKRRARKKKRRTMVKGGSYCLLQAWQGLLGELPDNASALDHSCLCCCWCCCCLCVVVVVVCVLLLLLYVVVCVVLLLSVC